MRAFLGKIGGRQVDRDSLGRKRKPDRCKRRAHSLAALGDGLVGEPDDDKCGQAGGKLDLHFDGASLEAEIGDSGDGRGHQAPPPQRPALFRTSP